MEEKVEPLINAQLRTLFHLKAFGQQLLLLALMKSSHNKGIKAVEIAICVGSHKTWNWDVPYLQGKVNEFHFVRFTLGSISPLVGPVQASLHQHESLSPHVALMSYCHICAKHADTLHSPQHPIVAVHICVPGAAIEQSTRS
eukprot:1314009-Amphidinium_carterae.1